MEDYKELIKNLKDFRIKNDWLEVHPFFCERAAVAIETLLAERDAAIEMLYGECHACKYMSAWHNIGKCATCKHEYRFPNHGNHNDDNWEWRGTQSKEEES